VPAVFAVAVVIVDVVVIAAATQVSHSRLSITHCRTHYHRSSQAIYMGIFQLWIALHSAF